MNDKLLMKGCRLNDSAFAAALRQIASNIEDGNLGLFDAMDQIERANTQHTKTSAIIVKTLMDDGE